MGRSNPRRTGVILSSVVVLAALTLATATPAVAAKQASCGGQAATIVGTRQGERIVGTKGPDVIAGLGGNDVIIGRGGNDLICGGAGADRLVGKAGLDVLLGNAGPDRLFGGDGPDRLFGGVGNDVLTGQLGNDHLNGGLGTDRCSQGQGTGAEVSCEAFPLPLTGILAVAFSDIDGLNGYSSGDVMIAMLVDSDANNVPSVSDTVVMGRYPADLAPMSFGDWGVTSHTVTLIETLTPGSLGVLVPEPDYSGNGHITWTATAQQDEYRENNSVIFSHIRDGHAGSGVSDQLETHSDSPSRPQGPLADVAVPRYVDDRFIDVELDYSVP